MKSETEIFAILDLLDIDINNNKHICTICGLSFKTESAGFRHIDNKHDSHIKYKMNEIEIDKQSK